MNSKTVQKFRGITRHSSIYMIFDNANCIPYKLKLKKEKEPKNKLKLSNSSSNSKINTKNQKSKICNTECPSQHQNKNINRKNTIDYEHKYTENRLPVVTNSKEVLKELENMSSKNDYYKRNVSEKNFGKKFCLHNPAYKEFSKFNREENLIKLGLNNEEKNPFDLISKKPKINFSNKNVHFFINNNKKNNKSQTKSFLKLNNKKFLSNKTLETSFFINKNEFSNYLIMEYIKKNYPSLITNKDNISACKTINKSNNDNSIKEQKLIINFANKAIEAREIYVIKDSTVIPNPRIIPGFLVKIPNNYGLKSLKVSQRLNLMKRFLEFINSKFRPQMTIKYIFDKNGNLISDFGQLSEKEKYIFASPVNLFQGISIPMQKGIIEIYLKYFGNKKKQEYFFNESSFDESISIYKNYNNNINNFDEIDDVYEIFFPKNINHKIKYFKKNKLKKRRQSSFTFGIDDNTKNNYEYIYYSDDRKKREKIYNEFSSKFKNRIDLYLGLKNSIYEKKLKELKSKLSENKKSDNGKKSLITEEEDLRDEYLTEKNIKIRDMLHNIEDTKNLKYQDIVDTFNLLKNFDPSMDIKKFYKPRKSVKNFSFTQKNIKSTRDKYFFNRRKINLEYPSLLNYNIPKFINTYPKYKLKDIIKYYTKFKSLVNLWLNMHSNATNAQFGIDFDTFYNCTEELCKEEKELANKIYDKINNSPNGFLSLEDFIEALNSLNQNDLKRQFCFFLKVFGNIGKKFLSYKEVLQISLISIKRLAKNNKTKQDDTIIRDLGYFFANYLFKICEANINNGIEIDKLRVLLDSQGEKLEYLKLFLLFDDDNHKNEIMKTLKEFKKKNFIK